MNSNESATRRTLPKPGDRHDLAGLKVSPYCLGWVREADTVLAAFDLGINFFFLAGDFHYPLYEQTRKGIDLLLARGKAIRENIVIAVVGYVSHPQFFAGVFDDVRWWSNVGAFDLAIIGGCRSTDDFMPRREVLLHRRNRIPYWRTGAMGASFHSRLVAGDAISRSLVDIAFIRYNAAHPGARNDLFPRIARARSTLVYNFLNSDGWMTPQIRAALSVPDYLWKPQLHDYYRFVLTRSEIDGILCAPKTPQDVARIQAAVDEGPLDPDEEEFLIELAAVKARAAAVRATVT